MAMFSQKNSKYFMVWSSKNVSFHYDFIKYLLLNLTVTGHHPARLYYHFVYSQLPIATVSLRLPVK